MCLVVGCGNKTGKKAKKNVPEEDKVKFSRVPKIVTNQGEMMETLTTERRQAWISAISRDDLTEEKLRNDKVCSRHFVSGKASKVWERYNVDWIPTLQLGHSKKQKKLKDPQLNVARAERRKRRNETIEKEVQEKIKKLDKPGETVESIFIHETDDTQEGEFTSSQDDGMEIIQECKEIEIDSADKGNLSKMFVEVGSQTSVDNHSSETMDAETQTVEFQYMFSKTKTQPFTQNYFENADDKVRFYTGLPDYDILIATFNFVSPYVTRKTLTLSLFQEFIMVLIKLRLNVPNQDLAYRFDISLSTASCVFSAWMEVLDVRLSLLIAWPDREELWRTMPLCFQYSFGKKTTIIIDCFEIFIERPSNLLARAQTFSHYKHQNTVKILIGITPQGSVSFVSKAWGGRTSDKYLTEHCGLLNKLNPGDLVMADRGFTIEENLALCQAKLAIPTFTKGKSQLDPLSVEKTRGIANVRIHVERVIGLLRQKYSILQSTLPIDYLICSCKEGTSKSCPMVDRIVRVCCALITLCPSMVPFD